MLTVVALPLELGYAVPDGHWDALVGWRLTLAVLAWLPLLAARRQPLPVLALASTIDAVHIGLAGASPAANSIVPAATMVALYTVTSRLPARTGWTATVAVAAIQYGIGLATLPSQHPNTVLYLNWAVVSAISGQLVQERRRRILAAAQRTAEHARRQVIAERVRIAGELHDVLAHHIAVVNAQAGVAAYLFDSDPIAARAALAGITSNSRAALDDLRATLGLLRDEDRAEASDDARAPLPRAAQLQSLLRTFTEAGMQLTVMTNGTRRPLNGPADLALYRITQEALTNATKHAPGSHVSVEVTWTEADVRLCITNTAPAAEQHRAGADSLSAGTGHGLLGMRERAAAAGGSLSTQPQPGGGFRVIASLPLLPPSMPAEGDPAVSEGDS